MANDKRINRTCRADKSDTKIDGFRHGLVFKIDGKMYKPICDKAFSFGLMYGIQAETYRSIMNEK